MPSAGDYASSQHSATAPAGQLVVRDLAKTYRFRGRSTDAVTGLSFSVGRGRALGILGPNGAGKTTTLRMLATLSRPSRGSIVLNGVDAARDPRRVRSQLGYVPQAGTLDRAAELSGELSYQGMLFGAGRAGARARGAEVLNDLGAADLSGRPVSKLSGGQRRRADIAMALVSRPQLLLLDEPTTGLDPEARGELWAMLRSITRERGVSIVFTTHYLEEAERIADDILLLERGALLAFDTVEGLRERYAVDAIEVAVDRAVTDRLIAALAGIAGVTGVAGGTEATAAAGEDRAVTVRARDGAHTLPRVLAAVADLGYRAERVAVTRGGLEDAFFDLTGRGVAA